MARGYFSKVGVLKTSGVTSNHADSCHLTQLVAAAPGLRSNSEEVVCLGSVESGRHGVCFGPAPSSDYWILRGYARVWLRKGGEPCSAAKLNKLGTGECLLNRAD